MYYEGLKPVKQKNKTPINLLDLYDEGIAREKLRKIELRKDAIMLLRVKQKYDIISQHFAKFKTVKQNLPFIKLEDGKNLLFQNPEEMGNFKEIYDITLEELSNLNITFFSKLPNLLKLSIRFSFISLVSESTYLSEERYPYLQQLDLNCNNLDNTCLHVIRHMKTLKVLNLMGNFITGDICDISSLNFLEELNLSYNHIQSIFVNLDMLKDLKLNNDEQTQINSKEKNLEDQKQEEHQDSIISQPITHGKNKERDSKQIEETQKTFQKLQVYLKTNLQDFYHKIALLKSLKILNLSNNKIHFFDIDPFFIRSNNGFIKLESIDLSHNLIQEEISILLVVNVPLLKHLNLSFNPISTSKASFENIEFEIFKSKNILIHNDYLKKTIKSKYNVKDILNYPPSTYLVKRFKIEPKNKKSLITHVKNEFTFLNETADADNEEQQSDEENKTNEMNNVELPLIEKMSLNPILMTRLDMVGKKKGYTHKS